MTLRFGAAALLAAAICASGQTPRRYTIDREIKFERGTDGARRLLMRTPEAREIVEGPFDIAAEDFNGDGAKEIVLIATSGPMCSDRGCSLLILEKRPGRIVPILGHFLRQLLAVTKESAGGYRALALLDGNGGIAMGEKGTPMAGKQMVFPMEPPK